MSTSSIAVNEISEADAHRFHSSREIDVKSNSFDTFIVRYFHLCTVSFMISLIVINMFDQLIFFLSARECLHNSGDCLFCSNVRDILTLKAIISCFIDE